MNTNQRFINCLRRIEFRYGLAGWHGDEYVRPELHVLYLDDIRLRNLDLRVPDELWQSGPPGGVLEYLADHLHLMPPFTAKPLVDRVWYGLAFVAEAWSADCGESADAKEFERLLVDGEARRVHLRPDRRNTRVVHGITRKHEVGHLYRIEGEDVVILDETIMGGVSHGMSRLVTALDIWLEGQGA